MLMMLLKDRVEDRLRVMADAVAGVGAAVDASTCGGPDLLDTTFSPYNTTTTDDTTTGLSGNYSIECNAFECIILRY